MPRFRAGQLDRRLKIEKRVLTRDTTTGELVESFVLLGEIWAEKLNERGIQRYAAQQLINEVETGWSMRWDPGLLDMTPDGHRVSENEHHFTVVQLVEIPRRQGIVVLGKARGEGLTVDGQVPDA
jgi:head-tail adaptor